MKDPLDHAADYQQKMNEEAIFLHNTRARNSQKIMNGKVICLDCGLPVQPMRLAAIKDAALCVMCAYEREINGSD